MSVRKKLNGMYLGGCMVFGAFIGLVFASWLAFAISFAVTAALQVMAGNIRPAGGHYR